MVKIPGLDDLKKMSSGWVDTATHMVDRLKNDIEAAGMKHAATEQAANSPEEQLKALQALMTKVLAVQAAQDASIKQLGEALAALEAKLAPPTKKG